MSAGQRQADGEPDPPGDPESVARIVCLRALTQRARTRSELATLLDKRGVPADAAHRVLDRFTEVGLVDDTSLAQNFAAAAHAERGLSRRAVAVKLRQRGVAEPTIQQAVELIDGDGELAAARTLAARRLRALGGLDRDVQTRRLVALLARRGYPPGLAYRVVRELLAPDSAEWDPAPVLDED